MSAANRHQRLDRIQAGGEQGGDVAVAPQFAQHRLGVPQHEVRRVRPGQGRVRRTERPARGRRGERGLAGERGGLGHGGRSSTSAPSSRCSAASTASRRTARNRCGDATFHVSGTARATSRGAKP